jgi:cytochrome c oxidase subunit 2
MVDPGSPFGTPFDPHSPETRAIAGLFTQTLAVCAVIFVVVTGLIVFSIVRFRARPGAGEPRQIEGHKKLEIVWTLVPCVIVVGLFALTSRAMALSDAPPDHDPDLIVTGHQWWWEVRYPNGAVAANEIHIPAGEDVIVRVESADVIHDFWAPALGRKIDATPGHPVFIRVQADVPGVYHGACAEYCGTEHAWMRFEVVASPRPEFDVWVAHQAAPAAPAIAPEPEPSSAGVKTFQGKKGFEGRRLFNERTCVECHAIRGTSATPAGIAPDLTHFASRELLGAGVLTNTPENLFAWLRDPANFKPGSHMPSLRLTGAETTDLVRYLEGLR